jgi:hypothetical protein
MDVPVDCGKQGTWRSSGTGGQIVSVNPADIQAYVDRLVARAGGNLESVVLSPFPFCGSQLLVVCRGNVPYLHEVMVAATLCDPPDVLTHWIRGSELRELSLPFGAVAVWFWWKQAGEYPGWSYWLRNRGTVLYGRDVRAEIPLPRDTRAMLEAFLAGSITYNRALLPVPFLIQQRYGELVEILSRLCRRLMATGLLLRDQWEIEEGTVLDRFSCAFAEDGARELCGELHAAFEGAGATADPGALRQRAIDAIWITERLERFLGRYLE